MHRGQLRESGTHQELLAHRGLYWKLYQLQYKDQEQASVVSSQSSVVSGRLSAEA
jgi:ATP-binding cassette subfamily B protein